MVEKDESFVLAQEVHNSFAAKVSGRLETLRINFYVFDRNYQELIRILEGIKNTEVWFKIWDPKNPEALDILLCETARLLQNFLASAKALVEHTQIVISSWYKSTEFLDEYHCQVTTRFRNNPLIGFVEELRNFGLHYSIPVTNANLELKIAEDRSSTTADFSLVLEKSILLEWSRWTRKGKAYLSTAPDSIDIGVIARDYYQMIKDFHFWMYERLRSLHASELAWLDEMRKRIINSMSEEERQDRGLVKQ